MSWWSWCCRSWRSWRPPLCVAVSGRLYTTPLGQLAYRLWCAQRSWKRRHYWPRCQAHTGVYKSIFHIWQDIRNLLLSLVSNLVRKKGSDFRKCKISPTKNFYLCLSTLINECNLQYLGQKFIHRPIPSLLQCLSWCAWPSSLRLLLVEKIRIKLNSLHKISLWIGSICRGNALRKALHVT